MSVLAKEIQKNFETSNEFLETGFQYAQKAGEYLAEAQELSGESFETWLNENCKFLNMRTAQKLIDFFNGEYIEVSAIHRTEEEVQEK
jgi:hypothetical protein